MTVPATLSTRHQELAILYELLYTRTGKLPSAKDLASNFETLKDLTQVELDRVLAHKPFKDYLINERAIPLNHTPKLTTKQLDWINAITDPTDQRPLTKKLSELGLKMAEVRTWNNNPFYAKVLYERTNKAFGNNRYAVLRSLQLEAMAGNISAIKLYLELTGDVETHNNSGSSSQTINVNNTNTTLEARQLLNAILEILQRHLQPELLVVIVDELEQATTTHDPVRALPAVPEPSLAQRKAAALEVRPYTPPSIKQVVEQDSDSDWLGL